MSGNEQTACAGSNVDAGHPNGKAVPSGNKGQVSCEPFLFHWLFPARFSSGVFLTNSSKSTCSLRYIFLLMFLGLNLVK